MYRFKIQDFVVRERFSFGKVDLPYHNNSGGNRFDRDAISYTFE